ncbi:hypothetical protein ACIPSJ_01485 [Streptomyces sp. NPDC090088]|uniref:hypothetical protein n=1 Tax=Streptomyces sp. NPDC090088 TaxID=3365944 RepID=UPI00382FDC3F
MDQLIEEVPAVSGPLKKYRVKRGGVETVMKLSDADAARLGVTAEDAVDGASTIQPVEPVTDDAPDDETGGSDGTADEGSEDGAQGTAPVISEEAGAQQVQPAAAKAPAKKAPAKRQQPAAASKARTAAANKAADGGS